MYYRCTTPEIRSERIHTHLGACVVPKGTKSLSSRMQRISRNTRLAGFSGVVRVGNLRFPPPMLPLSLYGIDPCGSARGPAGKARHPDRRRCGLDRYLDECDQRSHSLGTLMLARTARRTFLRCIQESLVVARLGSRRAKLGTLILATSS